MNETTSQIKALEAIDHYVDFFGSDSPAFMLKIQQLIKDGLLDNSVYEFIIFLFDNIQEKANFINEVFSMHEKYKDEIREALDNSLYDGI